MIRDAATERQVQAADPRASTWLSANAGSGKTRVLTDRVARLLLDGVDPAHILCLTYTKAAASEMQNRLFRRLGAWAMMGRDGLTDELTRLGVDGRIDAARIAEARRLFARAIETPGGLRIQTIHAFCAGLLRRFPREAGVSPRFTEMEDRAAQLLRREVVDQMALGPEAPLVTRVARLLAGDEALDPLLAAILTHRTHLQSPPDEAELSARFGLAPDSTAEDALRLACQGREAALVRTLVSAFSDQSATYRGFAADLATVTLDPLDRAGLETLFRLFLYQSGENRGQSKSANFPQTRHAAAVAAMAPIAEEVHDWMDRVAAARDHLLACDARDRTRTLHAFSAAFLDRYDKAKQARGLLDFDDLILRTEALLSRSDVAQWVLFRLDGGIDHILVDEAQDTSPLQWSVIERLAQEFASGEGAHPDRQRTIFVVGDKKQSIYSFQGADPEGFDRMQALFAERLANAGQGLTSLTLDHSFRSAEAVLRVVDTTFVGPLREGLGAPQPHIAFKEAMPGRVDLWPAIPQAEKPRDDLAWTDPLDRPSPRAAHVQLAEAIADEILRMKETETVPAEIGNSGRYARRPVSEGDILILVQRRSDLFAEIIRACKARGLAIAGSDRLKVGAELAVRDIAALLRFLALAEDDLSLAAALRSPLFGWSEQDLFRLAHGRGRRHLWQVLRDQEDRHPETLAILADLRRQADFLRPYDLINLLLIRHDGRRRLLARLGPEAEDGIDALLAQALAYEQSAIPDLTGFIEWMETDELEVKRQMEAQGSRIRVMTVHGAKGLEAPIVFLPDTAPRDRQLRGALLAGAGGPVWAPPLSEMPAALRERREDSLVADDRERRRLLYVAMTRAQSWLIVCGTARSRNGGGEGWHDIVSAGLRAAGAIDWTHPTGQGLRLEGGAWAEGALDVPDEAPPRTITAPCFTAVAAPRLPGTLSPSDLGGAKVLPGDPDGTDKETGLARGRLIHGLLDHLRPVAPEDRLRLGLALIAGLPEARLVGDAETIVAEVAALLGDPSFGTLFDQPALSEVAITAPVPALGGVRFHGVIDLLRIEPDRILALDYKTNRLVPETAAEVPEGLLRQMGAYRAMLEVLWPDRQVEVALLWTAAGRLMPLPAQDVAAALARATMP